MDLIDRYLTAIRWNLPAAKRDDIVAELRDVIASRIEDREEALDRPLARDEVAALLREFGHPLVVASRYGTHQYLVGPELFPFYWFALRIALAVCAIVVLVQAAVGIVAGEPAVMRAVLHAFNDARWSLLAAGGFVTLVFAVLERVGGGTAYLARWSPENLPDLGELTLKPKGAWERVFQIAAGIAFLLWWTGLLHVPLAYTNMQGVAVEPAPVWTAYFWPILVLSVARLVLHGIEWLRPRWRAVQAVLTLALWAAGVLLLAGLYQAGSWAVLRSAALPPAQLADIQHSLDLTLRVAIVATGVIWVCQALAALWRLYRTRRA